MSSLPHREPQPTPQPTPHTDQLVQALVRESQAHADANETRQRLRAALERHAATSEYNWWTPDDREAHLQVYYSLQDDQFEYIACELLTLDGRAPTVQERNCLESQFSAAMDESGDLCACVAGVVCGDGLR